MMCAAVFLAGCATMDQGFINVRLYHAGEGLRREGQKRVSRILDAAWAKACSLPDRGCLSRGSYAAYVSLQRHGCDGGIAVNIDSMLAAPAANGRKIVSRLEFHCEESGEVVVDSYS
jgi:hypothetical protein